ncbi:hypothetical protein CA260_10250 [Dyella jiangningensis]|uniref:Uncharacterized protein n=2 Tax=Dyella jiangningensis TaxID=1379159 RepID=A0A328P7B3_9GAMM|nr:hypothetical protein CA260_10250 [Dyella jiangningensis]
MSSRQLRRDVRFAANACGKAMQSELTHPIAYALSISRALWEFANDAVNDGEWPKPLAAAMSGRASMAAVRLGQFLAAGPCPADDCARGLRRAMVNLKAMSRLAETVVEQDMTSPNTARIARMVRCTAFQTTMRLKHIDHALDL